MSQSPVLTKSTAPRETTDSPSSRESSPERVTSRNQRSFSPESESSDSAAPQITVRDSSPPTDQPVLRQGLAFRTVPTKHINTYEPSAKAGDSPFLPGQEVQSTTTRASTSSQSPVVPVPPLSSAHSTPGPPASSSNPATPSPHLSAMSTPSDKSAAQKGGKKVAKQTARKTKPMDDTSFTTGRFRLSQYSATPKDVPPVPHGQSPFASVYRTPVPGADPTPPGSAPELSTSSVAPTSSAPTSGARITTADPATKSTRRNSKLQSIQLAMGFVQDDSTGTSPTQPRLRSVYPTRIPPSSQETQTAGISPPHPIPRVSISQPAPTMTSPMVSPGASHPPTNPPLSSAYYRRNYEADPQQPASRSEHSRTRPTSAQMNDSRGVDATMAPPPGESSIPQLKGKEREDSGQRPHQSSEHVRPPRGNVRLVTALIEDNRSNPPDHLLAEVYIRCWSGGRPDELWCDAKDLSEALQASASRIDGPAKVFTQRGAYRQCFLRITAEQDDKYNSMNLALASDRTIPISVEYWAPSGGQSKPGVDWRMPWHGSPTLSPTQRHTAPSQAQYYPYQRDQSSVHPPQHHHQPHTHRPLSSHHSHYSPQNHDDSRQPAESSRKRPSYNDQGPPDYPPESPLRRAPYGTQPPGQIAHDTRYDAQAVSCNTLSIYPRKRHVADASSPTDDDVRGDGVMDTAPDFKNSSYDSPHPEDSHQVVSDMIDDLMRVDITVNNYNRLIQSPKIYNTVHAYRMVEEICKKYVGRSLSVKGTTSHRISEADIAGGLGAEDPRKFISECREVLWLLDLYGERGKRGENPKVLEMLKENYRPDFNNVKPIKQLQKLLRDLDAQWVREHPEGEGGDNTRSTPRMS